jgi:hypothetical protein
VRGGEAKLRTTPPAYTPEKASSPGKRFIERLDANKDGKVSPDEFDGPPEGFRHFDRNGDGLITEDEAPQGPPPGRERAPRRGM